MSAVNNVNLVGNLGGEVELQFLPTGTAVAKFNIAVNRPPKNGEKQDPDWFKITLYGKRAEAAAKILGKGDKVATSGEIRTFKYKDKDSGKNLTGFGIEADDWQLLVDVEKSNSQGEDEFEPESSNVAPF